MVYCVAGCNQELMQAIVAQAVSRYIDVDDWRATFRTVDVQYVV